MKAPVDRPYFADTFNLFRTYLDTKFERLLLLTKCLFYTIEVIEDEFDFVLMCPAFSDFFRKIH